MNILANRIHSAWMEKRLKPYSLEKKRLDMVEIECPHCEQGIQLDSGDFGTFECPFCQGEFEWRQKSQDDERFKQEDFWIGAIVPFLPTSVGIFFSLVVFDYWKGLIVLLLSMCLWPVLAIGFAIYGYVKMKSSFLLGAIVSLVVSGPMFFILGTF